MMVDSVPRWRLSLSWPIQSDHLLIADCDDTAFGAGILTWQDPVHSWKAGPGEVLTEEKFEFELMYTTLLGSLIGMDELNKRVWINSSLRVLKMSLMVHTVHVQYSTFFYLRCQKDMQRRPRIVFATFVGKSRP